MDISPFTLLVVCIWSSYGCTVDRQLTTNEQQCNSIPDFAAIDEEFVFAACNEITELSTGQLLYESSILVYDLLEPLENGRSFHVGPDESSILVATHINNDTVSRIRISPDHTKIAAMSRYCISIFSIEQLGREVNLTFLNTHSSFSSLLQNFDWICSDRLLVAGETFLVIASAETQDRGPTVAYEGALGLQVTLNGASAYATTTSGFALIPLDSSYDIPVVTPDESPMEGAPFIDLAIDPSSKQPHVFLLNSTALISYDQTFTLSTEPKRLKARGGTVLVFGTGMFGLWNAGHFEPTPLAMQLSTGAITLNEAGMPALILAQNSGVRLHKYIVTNCTWDPLLPSPCSVNPSTTTGGPITTGCVDVGCCFKPTPSAVCIDGVWVVNMTDVIRGNVTITGGETLVVIGDLILNRSVVIVIESGRLDVKGDLISDTTIMNSQSTLNVDGHLHFNGSIVLNVGSRIPTGEIIIVTYNTSSGIPQIIVNAETEECTILTTTPQQRERSYAILFSVQADESSPECLNSDENNDDWIWIVIGVSIGVIVIVVAIGVFFFVRTKLAI